MKQAIVTGSTGLIGSALVRYLNATGVKVVGISRSSNDLDEASAESLLHIPLDMSQISTLPSKLDKLSFQVQDSCVFYNLAWSGMNRLTDGTFEQQLLNATYSAQALESAIQIGCTKFVQAGTMEETFLELYLDNPLKAGPLTSQSNYALAKIAARDMVSIQAYIGKIDYIHTRISAPLDPFGSSYISKCLKAIFNHMPYDIPSNKRPFDFIGLSDLAYAYACIGYKGKNKRNYYIGLNQPMTLEALFRMAEQVRDQKLDESNSTSINPARINGLDFSCESIMSDTDFTPRTSLLQLIEAFQP